MLPKHEGIPTLLCTLLGMGRFRQYASVVQRFRVN